MIPGSVGNHRGLLHENNYENSITLMCGEWLAQNSKKRVAGRGGGVLAGPDPSGCDSQEDSHQDRRWVLPVPAEAPLLSHPHRALWVHLYLGFMGLDSFRSPG